jgi:hypothetical protein
VGLVACGGATGRDDGIAGLWRWIVCAVARREVIDGGCGGEFEVVCVERVSSEDREPARVSGGGKLDSASVSFGSGERGSIGRPSSGDRDGVGGDDVLDFRPEGLGWILRGAAAAGTRSSSMSSSLDSSTGSTGARGVFSLSLV